MTTKNFKIRLLMDKGEHEVGGFLHTLHVPKSLDRSIGCITYDPKKRRVYFKDKVGCTCWSTEESQPLETKLPSEDFCVWNGAQVDPNGHPVFWLAELVSWDPTG